MKNFLKENWFKLIIAIIVVVVGFSITYYYVIFAPQKERVRLQKEEEKELKAEKESLINKNNECDKLGALLYEKDKTEAYEGWRIPFKPDFIYSQELGKCLYYGGDKSTSIITEFIKNTQTGEMIIYYMLFTPPDDEEMKKRQEHNKAVFISEYERLFQKKYIQPY